MRRFCKTAAAGPRRQAKKTRFSGLFVGFVLVRGLLSATALIFSGNYIQ
jgi:hypothetical protein